MIVLLPLHSLWWNPAVENQATDRAFRIGQISTVFVHRLITRASFEEKINEMIAKKRELSELSVTAGEKWISDLSDEELKDLLALEGGAISGGERRVAS